MARRLCSICNKNPKLPGFGWCESCRDSYPERCKVKQKGKRRGNPNWGRPAEVKGFGVPPIVTAFEKKVAELGLTEGRYARNRDLVAWVKKYAHKRWVPEALLEELGIHESYVLECSGRNA